MNTKLITHTQRANGEGTGPLVRMSKESIKQQKCARASRQMHETFASKPVFVSSKDMNKYNNQ